MSDITKRERQHLRRLAGEAYEAELAVHLAELEDGFARWRSGKILPSELVDLIHRFHQGPSRQTWSIYQTQREAEIVARGVALGILSVDELEPTLREKLEPLIALYRG